VNIATDRAVSSSVFERLGTRPVINACGIYTDLGGSRLSPGVTAAMLDANQSFVRMVELLESSGRLLARRLGADAGQVTPGAAASIALMVSAAMTGTDGAASERLPDTAGLKNEIVLQRNHRYKYDRQITMTGARLRLAGSEAGTTTAELEALVGARTAAVFVPAHLDGQGGTVPLRDVVAIARSGGVPVLVDAAYLCWPLEIMAGFIPLGVDLVCFSAKYFGGPNAGGFIVGARRLIDAVAANNFTRYESGPYRTYGRPFKLDRQTVVGVVVAFEEWLALDHEARWAQYARHVDRLESALCGSSGVRLLRRCFTMDERLAPEPVNSLVLEIDPSLGRTPLELGDALAAGTPSIACVIEQDRLIFCMDSITPGEVTVVGERLRRLLSGGD
jgi:L-seryl-tRNA(Ser) seleniumtransferase